MRSSNRSSASPSVPGRVGWPTTSRSCCCAHRAGKPARRWASRHRQAPAGDADRDGKITRGGDASARGEDHRRGARGLAARLGGGQRVGQAGEEDVEAALELGGAVVGGQGGGEAAQQGEFADRQPVQAQPQQVVGLVRVLDEFLQLVQDVAVQESEQGPVDVQGVGSAEPGACEQCQDVLDLRRIITQASTAG